MRIGDADTRDLYRNLVGAAFALVAVIAVYDRPGAVLAYLAVPFALPPAEAVRNGATGPALIAVLVATGRLQLVFGVLLALGLWSYP